MSGRNGVRVKCHSKDGECAGENSLYGAKHARHFLEIPGAYQFTQQVSLKEYPDAFWESGTRLQFDFEDSVFLNQFPGINQGEILFIGPAFQQVCIER